MENLVYGVEHVEDSDRSVERVIKILRRLRVSEEVVNVAMQDKQERWNEVLSHTQRHLLCLARGLITNPEVMCVHKPTLNFGDATSKIVMDSLREFVECKGFEQDMNKFNLRRRRTCITTAQTKGEVERVDIVFMISNAGIELVENIHAIEDHHFCNIPQ
eukprot:gnl/TRDRNA2_/TRDRNA2_175786_c0_seq3.p1 gnl/TRDRNA2_/TRDRNA2_175786_c0~~gnl/TRDRNA2_/TRDRNA2_175786_c0_seq3.p1  ORF type:complete len:188 (+),score=12.84 gnl/TRDRNA2_/TRDRNA2_175786_c0_seq3:85-564(+)